MRKKFAVMTTRQLPNGQWIKDGPINLEMEEARRRDPFAVGWFEDYLGVMLATAGRYREAVSCYEKMASATPWFLAHLTICYAELGEIPAAKAMLERFKSVQPGRPTEQALAAQDCFEDPTFFNRYRAIMRHLEAQD